MLAGTEREVLELLLAEPRSPTQVAEELDVSVQTASRNLTKLEEWGFVERTTEGEGRGYKRYRAREFTRVFAGFDGDMFDRTLPLAPTTRAMLSVLKVPQQEFHPVLLSYLFGPRTDRTRLGVVGIVVYGSVARGDAQEDSDVDLLVLRDEETVREADQSDTTASPDVEESLETTFATGEGLVSEDSRVVSETWFTVEEFEGGLDAGSQFLRNVLDEGIVLYDPEEVIRDARTGRAGRRVPG